VKCFAHEALCVAYAVHLSGYINVSAKGMRLMATYIRMSSLPKAFNQDLRIILQWHLNTQPGRRVGTKIAPINAIASSKEIHVAQVEVHKAHIFHRQ